MSKPKYRIILRCKKYIILNFQPFSGCCGLVCYPCQTYKTANSLNKSGTLYCLLACFFPCLPALVLRQETRHRWVKSCQLKVLLLTFGIHFRYGIDGTDPGDCGASFCFPLCVNCQTANEVKHQMNHWESDCHLNCSLFIASAIYTWVAVNIS